MGFSDTWIKLLMTCVSSVSYKFVHGGRAMGPLISSRGICQGDPLSPYLFIVCEKGFSFLLHRYEMNGSIWGCKVTRRAPMVSHMLFVDDNYVYCKVIEQEASTALNLLRVFEGIQEAGENSTYLGLPNTMGCKKTAILGFLNDWLKKQIQGWEGKLLSRAGKEVLLKAIAQSLPNCVMSVFLLPLDIFKELECLMARQTRLTFINSSFGNWWANLMSHSSTGVVEEAVMVALGIWSARNEKVWNDKSSNAATMVLSARISLEQ
ncbi:uncharacterized protein LOC133036587 [Cannabis sativa]|uniref:uncharacterized protein LOC133036587 n=1 Tax=Cannabis sativa TaxID=3483 RepID=UPI0029CAA5B2|nr:uncharacterized protein LOC133036587 [Cannabis sativa]